MSVGRQALITIVDYGMGNLHSVCHQLTRMGANTQVTSKAEDVARAEKLILPGVGHFGRAMQNIRELNLLGALHEATQVKRVPLLGICLGMQLMAKRSEEGEVEGLGWIDADVVRFRVSDRIRYKVPHVGWNTLVRRREHPLLQDVAFDAEFYFVHSYHLACRDASIVVAETKYSETFPSVVAAGNLLGVQLHPEKSYDAGLALLRSFVALS
jgi:glutamine amidotransferase